MMEICCKCGKIEFKNKSRYVIEMLLMISGISMDNDISIFCGDDNINRKYDVIISGNTINEIFELITCREEYQNKIRDARGRFLSQYSERKNIQIPLINHYAKGLREDIERAANHKNINLKTMERRFTIVLTHDVDNITDKNPYIFLHRIRKALMKIGRGKFREGKGDLIFAIKRIFKTDNIYWDFERFMALEKKYGFKSSFYFMNGRGGRYGTRYKLKRVKDIMNIIESSGFEAALHTNYHSFNNSKRIEKEKTRIEKITGKTVYGCRNHYLRFDVPKTWGKIEDAGLKYDTTLGYSDAPGFRAGIAFPFYPYDLRENRMNRVLEIPLVLMDQTMLGNLFEDGDGDEVWKEIEKILDEIRNVEGIVAVNFHTGIFCTRDYPGWANIYIRILEYLKKYAGRGITARELWKLYGRL